MGELIITLVGLSVAALAGCYSIWTDGSKPRSSRSFLLALTGLGLAAGVAGAIWQEQDQAKAQTQLDGIQGAVGESGLTSLNQLGRNDYYVAIDTFQDNERSREDFMAVRHRLLGLFPEAEKNGMLWGCTVPPSGKCVLRFGRKLSLTSAETFWNLASHGISNGTPLIRREQ